MSFLSPWFLVAGAAGVAALVVAHLIVVRQRTAAALPTIRFVPRDAELAPTIRRVPADLALLALRAGAVALVAVALARPVVVPRSTAVARVVVADFAGAADRAELRRRARELAGDGGAVVETGADDNPGSLSAGLVAGIRRAARSGAGGERVRLSVVSPFSSAAFDAATDSIRAVWPGRIELVSVRAAPAPAPERAAGAVITRGAADDGVLAGFSLVPRASLGGAVRVLRDSLMPTDSAAAARGEIVVVWPASRHGDTIAGIVAGEAVVIAEFTRAADARSREGTAIARWIDGPPAAVERRIGSGCVRFVSVGVPEAGDIAISRPFVKFLRQLVAPCGPRRVDGAQATAERRARLAGVGPPEVRLANAGGSDAPSLVRWLLAAALGALLIELAIRAWMRRRA